jgi:hypothetical protein
MIMLAVSGMAFAVGGEDIATAVAIPGLPFSDVGDTCSFINNYDEVGVFNCPYTSTAPDVVYSYSPAGPETIDIDLGASLYDTKVFVYENSDAVVVGCDDDYYANYTSAIFGLELTGGNTYYIVVAGYGSSCGSYDLQITGGGPAGEEACLVADSQAAVGMMSHTVTLAGGYNLGDISWDGFALPYNTGTYGSELRLSVSGPLGSALITLGSGTTFPAGANFTGTSVAFAGGGDPAGVWTFDFYESYDDGGDGLPDAIWDDICFTFNEAVGCFGPDTCAEAELIGPGSLTASTSECTNAFNSYNLWPWTLTGLDHVYVINVPCAGSEICVTMTPLEGQDPAVAMATACTDGSVTAIAGADNGLGGDAESFCYTLAPGEEGNLYIYCDFYGGGSGAYQLDVTVVGPVTNDTCETAIDVTGGGLFSGTTACATNDYNGAGCGFSWSSAAPDAAYVINVNDGDTVDVAMIPLDGQDPILYMVGDCADPAGTCVAGSDTGLGGDPEYVTATFDCAGTYYIIADGWSSAQGAFDLDVVVTPAVPVDTFDVSMLCDPDPLTLPTQTKIRVYVTNTSDTMRQFCGSVGVTLCNGAHISNIRSGSMVLAAGETKFIGWGQVLPANARTCDCTLVFDVVATDCTPCADTGAYPAGWTETATCGITTVCP